MGDMGRGHRPVPELGGPGIAAQTPTMDDISRAQHDDADEEHHPKLISEPIKVEMEAPPGGVYAPVRMHWRDETLEITAVLQVFAEAGLPRTARTDGWWLRRRRTHWIVRASDGHVYQIYLDRSGKRRDWVLLKRIE